MTKKQLIRQYQEQGMKCELSPCGWCGRELWIERSAEIPFCSKVCSELAQQAADSIIDTRD